MMNRILFFCLLFLAQQAPAQDLCPEKNNLIGVLLTDNIKKVEANFAEGDLPSIGTSGELHLRFETPLGKGGKMSGWLQIATVKVSALRGRIVVFQVLEESSKIVINGDKANHFRRDNVVKFTYQLNSEPQEHLLRAADGKLLEKGTLVCGKLQGDFLTYHADGTTIKDRSNYEKGKRQGNAFAYHANGLPSTSAQYRNDTLHGIVEKFSEKGNLRSRFEFKNGQPDGVYTMFYSDGTKEEMGTRKGDNFANIQLFRLDGTLQMEVERSDAGVKRGKVRYYREDGKTLKKEERYDERGRLREELNFSELAKAETRYEYDTAQLVTHYEVYHPNGTLALRRQPAQSDTLGGAYTRYYPNAEKQEEGFYCLLASSSDSTMSREQPCNTRRSYHESGQLKETTQFKDGKQEGAYRSYHPNGKPHITAYKQADAFEGAYAEYDEAGNLVAEGSYSAGKRVGKWKERNERGKLKKVKW